MTFDYLLGRPLKVNISSDMFEPGEFDCDAGAGVAEMAIVLRQTDAVTDEEIGQRTNDITPVCAHEAMDTANTVSTQDVNTFILGGADVSQYLISAVEEELNRRREH